MFARNKWLLRAYVCLNVVVLLLYVGPHLANRSDLMEQLPSARGAALNAAQMVPQMQAAEANASLSTGPEALSPRHADAPPPPPPAAAPAAPAATAAPAAPAATSTQDGHLEESSLGVAVGVGGGAGAVAGAGAGAGPLREEEVSAAPPPAPLQSGAASSAASSTASSADPPQTAGLLSEPEQQEEGSLARSLREAVPCHDKAEQPRMAQRSDFWVLYHYVPARRRFHCWESVTYTTHAHYTFLDNLLPLLDRWQGPVSLALHAPGTDFKPTLEAIRWARACVSPLVGDLVTFHVFFDSRHIPREVPRPEKALSGPPPNCTALPPWTNVSSAQLYKSRSHILYPVNVGRNVARESAATHFVFPSDIELYPSPGTITAFLEMIRRNDPPLRRSAPKVYPLSIFELEKGAPLPENKSQLISMLKNGTAMPFHKKICPECHNIPHAKEWLSANITDGLHVFHIGKRTGNHVHWEPIFIGTNKEPLYDERLSWEGKLDKMTQGYALCVLDYEFHILDNAFLVHKPGIKTLKKDPQREILASKTNNLIKKVIFSELKVLFGVRKGCAL